MYYLTKGEKFANLDKSRIIPSLRIIDRIKLYNQEELDKIIQTIKEYFNFGTKYMKHIFNFLVFVQKIDLSVFIKKIRTNYYDYRLEIVSEFNSETSALTHNEIEYLLTNNSNGKYLSRYFNKKELEEFDSRSNITKTCKVRPRAPSVF